MDDEAKFKIGDMVRKAWGQAPGEVIDINLLVTVRGTVTPSYRVKFQNNCDSWFLESDLVKIGAKLV